MHIVLVSIPSGTNYKFQWFVIQATITTSFDLEFDYTVLYICFWLHHGQLDETQLIS